MNDTLNYTIRSGFEDMNFDAITEMLKNAYWSCGISKEEVIQGAGNSALVAGVFLDNGEQIAYSRVISDKTRFAYILDVYVMEKYRKLGLGGSMVNYLLSHPDLKDVYQWLLITKDAHGVYQKTGFQPLSCPVDWMEIRHERPDR